MFQAFGLLEMSEIQDVSKVLVKALVLMTEQKHTDKVRTVNLINNIIVPSLRPSNTGIIFLQLARNIVALQVEKRCCTYYHPPQTLSRNKISLLQVEEEAACCIKLNWCLLFSTNVFPSNRG